MIAKAKKENNKITVIVSGRVDSVTAPEFLECVKNAMNETKDLVIDLTDADYISSAGLRVILYAAKNIDRSGSLLVTHPNDDVYETFELTGFTDLLKIER